MGRWNLIHVNACNGDSPCRKVRYAATTVADREIPMRLQSEPWEELGLPMNENSFSGVECRVDYSAGGLVPWMRLEGLDIFHFDIFTRDLGVDRSLFILMWIR